jgi:hypothetical protein
VKTARPCSVPRTARARATAAPRTTCPVALTLRQAGRHLWWAKQATLHFRHNDRVKKKVRHVIRFLSFSSSSFSLLQQGPGKGIPRKGSFSAKETGPEPPYWSEVRRPAPRKGSTAASGHSGSAPTTDQGFVGWPLKGFDSRLRRRARDDPGYVRYITKARATLLRYPRTFLRPTGTIFVTKSHQREASSPRTPSKGDLVRQITRRYFWSASLGH